MRRCRGSSGPASSGSSHMSATRCWPWRTAYSCSPPGPAWTSPPTPDRPRETATPGDREPADALRPRAAPADGAAASLRDEVEALVDELAHADRAHLTPEAGALDPAQRDLGGLGGDGVHMRHSDLEAGRDTIGTRLVGGEHRSAQTECTVIGQLEGLLVAADPVHSGDGPEDLLTIGLGVARDVDEHRRRIVRGRPLGEFAADEHPGSSGYGLLHLGVDGLGRGP